MNLLVIANGRSLPLSYCLLTLFAFFTLSGTASANALKLYSGDPLPHFELSDLSGVQHSSTGYEGQVLLVNFWATWCPPCVQEMPSMQRLKSRLAGRPFSLIAINMGEESDVLNEFLKRIDVDFTILQDRNGTVTRDWGLFAFPTSFLLDDKGRVTHVVYGELEWDSPAVLKVIEPMIATAESHSPNDNLESMEKQNPDGTHGTPLK